MLQPETTRLRAYNDTGCASLGDVRACARAGTGRRPCATMAWEEEGRGGGGSRVEGILGNYGLQNSQYWLIMASYGYQRIANRTQ